MDDPLFSMTSLTQVAGPTDLFELGFAFAISKVDPSIATPKVEHTYWNKKQDKEKRKIDMVDCSELLPGGKHQKWGDNFERIFSLEKLLFGRVKSDFLCPINLESL